MAGKATVPVILQILAESDPSLNRELEEVQGRVRASAGTIADLFGRATLAQGALLAGLVALGRSAVGTAADFELLRAKLETVQHSAAEAQKTFDAAVKLAASTPFDVKSITAAAVQLEVFGQNSRQVLPQVADLVQRPRNSCPPLLTR